MNDFINECLEEHNSCRKLHHAPPLKHNKMLDESALEWAQQLLTQEKLSNSQLSTRGMVGENISMRTSSKQGVDLSGREVTQQWYKDVNKYNFKSHSGPAGNFTQLVWKSSDEVGFAKVTSPGRCIVVAHYRPPGNVHGLYDRNVLPANNATDNNTETSTAKDSDANNKTKERETTLFEIHQREDGTSYEVRKEVKDAGGAAANRKVEEIPMKTNEVKQDFRQHLNADGLDEKFINETIERHNFYRQKHQAPSLQHNTKLSKKAQQWAEYLSRQTALSNSNTQFRGARVGENIASRWSNGECDYSGFDVVDHWYQERAKYNYTSETTSVQGIGNFTQMIWKASNEIGIGKARVMDENGCTRVIVVCQYSPPGNIFKSFCLNVAKPTTDS